MTGLELAARALRDDGFCRIEGVLDADTLDRQRAIATAALGTATPEHRATYRSEGSLVPVADLPGFADLIAEPALHAVFRGLGLGDTRFSSGYVISKPPGGPALFWHQDWWGWGHPLSYTDCIAQVFVFVYLTDTTPENGCLRVIPGSHRRRHRLHELRDAHSEALARVDDPDHPAFAGWPGETPVPVRAGDVVIGDARLLHGAYANRSAEERTLVTLWFHPDFERLPEPIRARLVRIFERQGVDTDAGGDRLGNPSTWPEPGRSRVAPYLVRYAGSSAPEPWSRTPGPALGESPSGGR